MGLCVGGRACGEVWRVWGLRVGGTTGLKFVVLVWEGGGADDVRGERGVLGGEYHLGGKFHLGRE